MLINLRILMLKFTYTPTDRRAVGYSKVQLEQLTIYIHSNVYSSELLKTWFGTNLNNVTDVTGSTRRENSMGHGN